MPRPTQDPSGPATPYRIRLAPRYVARLPELAAKWACSETQAVQRAVRETIEREVGL